MTGVLPCTHATGVDTGLISLTLRTKPLQHIVIQADGDLLLTGVKTSCKTFTIDERRG